MSGVGGRPSLQYRLAAGLVRLVGRLVPREQRDRWVEEWQAELWHRGVSVSGILADALAMRRVTWSDPGPGPSNGGRPDAPGRGRSVLVGLKDDLVQAALVLRAGPGFTVVAVLVFAAGIGAGTAAFGLLDAVLWSPLDLPDAGRLVQVQQVDVTASGTYTRTHMSMQVFREVAGSSLTLAGIAGVHDSGWENVFYLTGTDEPERLEGALVTADFFEVVGARAAVGRVFTAENAAGGDRIAVLAHGLWTRRFAADPEVVGSTVRLNGEPFLVVGVLPASFELDAPAGTLLPDDEVEVWAPAHVASGDRARRRLATGYDQVLARVRPSSTVAEAEAELERIVSRVDSSSAGDRSAAGAPGHRVRLVPVRERLLAPARAGLLLLAGIVGVVLLLVWLNVTGLQLARTAERGGELAVRAALGAGPGRLARQLAAEGLLLALGGGLVASLATTWTTDLVAALAPASIPRLEDFTVPPRAYAFGMALATASGLLASLLPAWIVSRSGPGARLESGRGASSGRGAGRLRNALVVGQVAVATVLLIGGGLLARSFWNLQAADHGMRVEDVATLDIWVPSEPAADEAVRRYFERVLEATRSAPGVVDAALASSLPFRARDYYAPEWRRRVVSPGYFELLDIPVRRGRTFTPADRPGSGEVAVINDALARRWFGDRDPLGRRLGDDPDDAGREPSPAGGPAALDPGPVVVGVVADSRHVRVDEPALPAVYVPHAQSPDVRMSLMVRTRGDPGGVLPSLRAALREIDPDQPLANASTLETLLAESAPMQARRFNLQVLAACGGVAVLLALLGIYAVLARSVAQRRREFGIRVALGARGADVCGLVLRQGAVLATAGALLGGMGALGLSRVLGSLLYGVGVTDPPTYSAVAIAVIATSLLATWIPARRVLSLDPTTVLTGQSLR